MKVVYGEKMMKRLSLVLLFLIIIFVAIPAAVTYADPGFDRVIGEGETVEEDIVVFGGTLLVEPGATVDGSVSVFGGEVELAGTILGDVAIFGGQATISGFIDGDMAVLGGNLHTDTTAAVAGDCILVGGTISGDGKDTIGCTGFGDLPNLAIPAFVGSQRSLELPVPLLRSMHEGSRGPGFFVTVGSVIGRSMFLGLIALLLASAAPSQLNRVSRTMRQKPGATGAVGVFTLIAGISLITIIAVISAVLILVCVGILGIPLVIVMSLALFGALIMGWIAAGSLLGKKMIGWLKLSSNSLPIAAVLGTVTLTMAAGLFSAMPWWLGGWVWWLVAAAIGCAGLGAAALTRFGTRSYPVRDGDIGVKVNTVLDTMPDEDISLGLDEDINLDPAEKPPVE
jgi:hypothetical protein